MYELMAPCHFGLEAVLKREIYDLGYEITSVEDGHVCYSADEQGMVLSNLCLRTAERVLLVVGRFTGEVPSAECEILGDEGYYGEECAFFND